MQMKVAESLKQLNNGMVGEVFNGGQIEVTVEYGLELVLVSNNGVPGFRYSIFFVIYESKSSTGSERFPW